MTSLLRISLLSSLFALVACGPAEEPMSAADAGPGGGGGGGGDADAGVECTATCEVEFTFPFQAGVSSVELRGDFGAAPWEEGIALTSDGSQWHGTLELEDGEFVQYKYVLNGSDWVLDPDNRSQLPDFQGNVNSVAQADCGCKSEAFNWEDSILYFVFLDRFNDGDPGNNGQVANVPYEANYQGGDLKGVTQKIEEGYFDELGVNTLWLTSPFENSDSAGLGMDGRQYSAYHGYWPTDLERIDSRVGTIEELAALVDAAHARGMKVLIDYAMNHVHADSPLYRDNPDWFWPNDNGFGGNCVCGEGCSWEGDEGRRCWFRDYLPDFNFTHPEARAWSVNNAVEFAKATGIDGYRLDAVKHIESQWLYELRSRIREEVEIPRGEDFYMVGETFSPDSYLISTYVDPLTQLHGQFDFPMRAELARTLLRRDGSMGDLAGFLNFKKSVYHPDSIMSTFIGNHDLPRVIHAAEDTPMFGDWDGGQYLAWDNRPAQPNYRAPYERMGLAFAFLMTSPGIPLIYYGDEIGLAGAGDPDNRRFMQWDGINEHQAWLKQYLQTIGTIRRDEVALRRGELTVLDTGHDTITYEMRHGDQRIVIAINRSDVSKQPQGIVPADYTDLISGDKPSLPLELPPRSAVILKVQ